MRAPSPGLVSRRTGEPCTQCGEVHTKCSSHAKGTRRPERKGRACQKPPMHGADVCANHGGRAPQVRQRIKREAETEAARAMVATYGLPIDVEPQVAIIEEIARTNGHVVWLGEVVAALEAGAVVWGRSSTESKVGTEKDGEVAVATSTEIAGVNVWVQLYRDERRHLVDVCAKAISLGLREREVELARQQGEMLARIIRAVIGDPELGLDREAQGRAMQVASRHLRVVSAAG